jgi:hypothetical protein
MATATPTATLAARLLALASLGALLSACGSDQSTSGIGAACTRTSDCQTGLSCAATGLCTAPDAGVPEGGSGDSGSLDARSAG